MMQVPEALAPLPVEYVPEPQSEHTADEAPPCNVENVPLTHRLQVLLELEPNAVEKLPGGHREQFDGEGADGTTEY
jgi:hypothetical protein